MLSKLRKNQKGFTLIELLIVIAIIGILAAIAIPQFAAYRIRAYNSAAQSDAANFCLAQEAYYTDHPTVGYTAVMADLRTTTYGLKATSGVTNGGITASTTTFGCKFWHISGDRSYTATQQGVSG